MSILEVSGLRKVQNSRSAEGRVIEFCFRQNGSR